MLATHRGYIVTKRLIKTICQLPGMQGRHLQGDYVSTTCSKGPDDLLTNRVGGAPEAQLQ